VRRIETDKVFRAPTPAIRDAGMVRMGFVSPAFPPVRSTPANVADNGNVQMGFVSPAFPPAASR